MLKGLCFLAAGFIGIAAAADSAEANACRALEMHYMQAQAGGNPARLRSAHNLLLDRGCRGGRRITEARPKPRVTRVRARREAAASRTAKRSPERREKRETEVARGTFRTLCVRRCDGYYFPISFSTTRKHFEADQASCQQMCPAGDAGLYYHELGSQGPEDMLSLDGGRYTALPTAFGYRTALDKSCTCGRPADAGAVFASAEMDETPVVSVANPPRPRPPPGEDPETLANRAGGFVPAPVDQAVAGVEPQPPASVRLVGPTEVQPVILTEIPN
jgi:Protein of unknown function (DUF2865)